MALLGGSENRVHWFTAGVLGAIGRHLHKDERPDDYFVAFIKAQMRTDESMSEFFELFHAKYQLLPLEQQMRFTGAYVGYEVLAPIDLEKRMASIEDLIQYESRKVSRALTGATGLEFEIDGLGHPKFPAKNSDRTRRSAAPMLVAKRDKRPSDKGDPKPGPNVGEEPGESEPDDSTVFYDGGYEDLTKCCEELGCRLLKIEVQTATVPQALNDDIYVRGAQTAGPHVSQGGQAYHWPKDSDGAPTMQTLVRGASAQINETVIAAAPTVNECWAKLGVALTFWEGDWGDVKKALRATIQAYMSAAAVALLNLDPLAAPLTGPIEKLSEALLDLLGLSDESMGSFGFGIKAPNFHPKQIRDYVWSPTIAALTAPNTGVAIADEHDTYITFKVTLANHGGIWNAWVQVYRTCVSSK